MCQKHLLCSANGHPIISVSQQPIDFGENICVGDIGRSWLSLYKQLFEGVRRAKTKYVAMAEHDCVYAPEHFRWIPPREDTFYYNDNCWLVQHSSLTKPELNGLYSYWPKRYALSQLICNRELLKQVIDKRLNILDKGRNFIKQIAHIAEPGITKINLKRLQEIADSGRSVYLRPMLKAFEKYLDSEKWAIFKTEVPNLDIRHTGNFTGPKRGNSRKMNLPPWGTLQEVLSA